MLALFRGIDNHSLAPVTRTFKHFGSINQELVISRNGEMNVQ